MAVTHAGAARMGRALPELPPAALSQCVGRRLGLQQQTASGLRARGLERRSGASCRHPDSRAAFNETAENVDACSPVQMHGDLAHPSRFWQAGHSSSEPISFSL